MAKEYIEKDRAVSELVHDYAYAAAEIVKAIPAADVVEVVRCSDCKHSYWEQEPCHGKTEHFCKIWSKWMGRTVEVDRNFSCINGAK